MYNNKKKYYGDFTDNQLLRLLVTDDYGAYSEILQRLHQPLVSALSDQLTSRISIEEPLPDYIDFLLYAERNARRIVCQTFTLLWENRSRVNSVTLYHAVLEMLKIALDFIDVHTSLPYGEILKSQVISRFVLQPGQLKRNQSHKTYVSEWLFSVHGINTRLFILKYFSEKKITQIREELGLSILEVETDLQIIQLKFEDHLQHSGWG